MTTAQHTYDVIIAGAGPGGSTTAAFLARGGLDVLVVEEKEFPRFRIGESLLPVGCQVLRSLGIEATDEAFVHKRGAVFLNESQSKRAFFGFSEAIDKSSCHAWHVERASFDDLLLNHALSLGAKKLIGERVTDLKVDSDTVSVATPTQQLRAKYFVDATGQGRFLAKKFGTIAPIKNLGKAAVYRHFDGVSDEVWNDFAPNHDIRVIMVDEGWIWVIPLPRQRLSIGLVSRQRGIRAAWLDEAIEQSPSLKRWTDAASSVSEPTTVSNFSYTNTDSYGARYACVGDSACFLDPVFSSGVSLALQAGERVSSILLAAFERGDIDDPNLMDAHKATMQRAYDTFSAMIHRFYNTKFVDNMIFGAPEDGEFRAGVTSILAGDVFRDDNTFQNMLLRSRRPQTSAAMR